MKAVLSNVLVTTAGLTSQMTASSGTITSAKPNAVTDWQTAARKAMSATAIKVSLLKSVEPLPSNRFYPMRMRWYSKDEIPPRTNLGARAPAEGGSHE
jgi:hypothetical protein